MSAVWPPKIEPFDAPTLAIVARSPPTVVCPMIDSWLRAGAGSSTIWDGVRSRGAPTTTTWPTRFVVGHSTLATSILLLQPRTMPSTIPLQVPPRTFVAVAPSGRRPGHGTGKPNVRAARRHCRGIVTPVSRILAAGTRRVSPIVTGPTDVLVLIRVVG